MEIGPISTRYAKALLSFAEDNKAEDQVYEEMSFLSKTYFNTPELKSIFENPIVTKEERIKILTIAAGKTISKTTEDFIRFVVDKKKENVMLFISMSYQKLYRNSKNIISAELVSAQKIDDTSVSEMLSIIQKVYKEKTIQLSTHINPELIGGFVLNVENNKFDASVVGELNAIKKEFKLYNLDSKI